MKFETLVSILDQIRKEAPQEYKFYYPLDSDEKAVSQARSRAFIHLFLKVKFGILDFTDREQFVSDGTQDGGIDAYFVDYDNRVLYFVQSKFRMSSETFQSRNIALEDLLAMDIGRVTKGEREDAHGVAYNSKVQALITELQQISDLPRYSTRIVLIANIKEIHRERIRQITGGFDAEVYNFERCYDELVYPVVSGTYYNAADLKIKLILQNAAHRISYAVKTEFAECQITVLFVPTVEIAKALYQYRNSILKFNPRSFIDFQKSSDVNSKIAETITEKKTNEFALFNNGITLISDDTSFSDRVARKGEGELIVTNPQIVNGGQTAYTLSTLYDRVLKGHLAEEQFEGKEVLLKVITFGDAELNENDKLRLIESISRATNEQTPVTESDRRANEKVQVEIQKKIYSDFGYFYERKRGEFGDGVRNRYIPRDLIIDRAQYLRVALAASGSASQARRNSEKVLFGEPKFAQILPDSSQYRLHFYAYSCDEELSRVRRSTESPNNKFGALNYGNALRYGGFAVISVASKLFLSELDPSDYGKRAKYAVESVLAHWLEFEKFAIGKPANRDYFRQFKDAESGEVKVELNFDGYYKGRTVNDDLAEYFGGAEILDSVREMLIRASGKEEASVS